MGGDAVVDEIVGKVRVKEGNGPSGGDTWADARPRKPSDELVAYMKSVGGSLESAIGDEEAAMLIRNVFDEIKGHEASLACNRRTSLILESLLKRADAAHVAQTFEGLKEYFGFLIYNRQASHVVQLVISRSAIYLAENRTNEDQAGSGEVAVDLDGDGESGVVDHNSKERLKSTVLNLCETLVLLGIWWDMLFDPCATHVLRSLFLLLAGDPDQSAYGSNASKKTTKIEKHQPKSLRSKKTNPEFVGSLYSFLSEMSKWGTDQLKQVVESPHASPVMQILLRYCKSKKKAWQKLFKNLLFTKDLEAVDPTAFKSLARNRAGSHVLETIMSSCDNDTYDNVVFNKCIKGQMVALAEDPFANFVLQQALLNMNSADQCQQAFEELEGSISNRLLDNRPGVVWRLCQACKLADKTVQRRLCQAIVKGARARASRGVGFEKTTGLANSLLELDTIPERSETAETSESKTTGNFQSSRVSIMGAQIIAALLSWCNENCRVLLESIASVDTEKLVHWCNDPIVGKHVMETLMELPATAAWARNRVVLKLKGEFGTVAQSKFGWHVLRKAYDNGGIKEKTIIVKALDKVEKKMSATKTGSYSLVKHCKLQLYRTAPDQWRAAIKVSTSAKRDASVNGFLMSIAGSKHEAKRQKVS